MSYVTTKYRYYWRTYKNNAILIIELIIKNKNKPKGILLHVMIPTMVCLTFFVGKCKISAYIIKILLNCDDRLINKKHSIDVITCK